jgi:DNA-binding CsgD family transcriptional regulator
MIELNNRLLQGFGPSLLDQLFPGWVVIQCTRTRGSRFLSSNGAAFFGLSATDRRMDSLHDLSAFVHPDEVEAYRRVGQRTADLLQDLTEAELAQHRFVTQYRLRRGGAAAGTEGYVSVHEENLFYLNEHREWEHFTLLKELPADRAFTRVQLDWYHVHELGYRKIGSYVPTTPEQALTSREIEVVHLIREGLSSKEIAARLFISLNTVRNHRSNLFRKTNARNVVDLVTGCAVLAESMA